MIGKQYINKGNACKGLREQGLLDSGAALLCWAMQIGVDTVVLPESGWIDVPICAAKDDGVQRCDTTSFI